MVVKPEDQQVDSLADADEGIDRVTKQHLDLERPLGVLCATGSELAFIVGEALAAPPWPLHVRLSILAGMLMPLWWLLRRLVVARSPTRRSRRNGF